MTDSPSFPHPKRWFVLFGVWLIYFAFGIVVASMAPLVGPISAELGIDNSLMGFIFGAWPFTYIVAAIPCGILIDRLGVRQMLLGATVIIGLSAILRGLAETPIDLLLAVALFGVGGPIISIGAPKVITTLFEGKNRATAMGIYITGPYLGGLVALALTNSVAMPLAGDNWRSVMIFNGVFVILCGLIWMIASKEQSMRKILRGGESGKKFSLVAFTEILHISEVRIILAMSIGIFFINHGLSNWLPEILRGHGFSPVKAGYWAALPAATGIIGVLLIPRLATPERRITILISLFLMAFVASLLIQSSIPFPLFTGLILLGIARTSMMTISILLLMEAKNVPKESLGLAGGMFFTTAEVGGVFGPVTLGVLSDVTGSFTLPLFFITLVCTFLLLLALALKRANRPSPLN